jgi:hypothetical protein
LNAPLPQIPSKAGEDGGVVVGKELENRSYQFGFDAPTAKYGDIVAKGIIDPRKVVRLWPERVGDLIGLIASRSGGDLGVRGTYRGTNDVGGQQRPNGVLGHSKLH